MNTKTTPRDFFLHLGAIIALIVSVVSIINLYFSIINYYFPDQLASYFYSSNIAWPISVLIVLVPLLYIFEYLINKDIAKFSEKAELWIRKWRVYLTLFITGATIVGDLIALLNVYLSGEISSRFLYKVLSVIVISGIIFAYYILSKNNPINQSKNNTKNIFAVLGIVVALLAVVLGFVVVGSPTKQRNLRFDSTRVSDLSNIQWQIINHWQQKSVLPGSLSDLEDSVSGYSIPKDPETKADYGYKIIAANGKPSFELCADFALETPDNKGRGDYYGKGGYAIATDTMYSVGYSDGDNNWKHSAGKSCFTRTIDPDKYPVNKK
jgi:type II secretory pathway pseudopilin PulG